MTGTPALPDRAAVRIFPPAAPLLTILGGIFLQRVAPLPPAGTLAWPWRVFGAIIVVAAILALGARAVVLVRRSGQSENPWKPTTAIVQSGPFSRTRNPMYLQMVLGCLGFSLVLSNSWILILTPLCVATLTVLAIRPEEEYLERKFGDGYREYKARVPRWF